MLKTLFKSKLTYLLIFLYLVQLGWWLAMQFLYTPSDTQTYFFNAACGNIAIVSVIAAFSVAWSKWGGFQSLIGKMLIFLGLGLFFEWLGILAWLHFNLTGAAVPYPSLADVGYFGLVPMYIIASIMLARAAGVQFTLGSRKAKLLILALPVLALSLAFGLFLRKIGYSGTAPLELFFNIAYPIGEIIPMTIALLVLVLSTRLMGGGVMRNRVLLLVFAFFMQFLAEYVFLYQAGSGTYLNAGVADMLYATSYFVMGLSILSFHQIEEG